MIIICPSFFFYNLLSSLVVVDVKRSGVWWLWLLRVGVGQWSPGLCSVWEYRRTGAVLEQRYSVSRETNRIICQRQHWSIVNYQVQSPRGRHVSDWLVDIYCWQYRIMIQIIQRWIQEIWILILIPLLCWGLGQSQLKYNAHSTTII